MDVEYSAQDQPPPSPCVGICQLQGPVCIGCGRVIGEIAEWGAASVGRKVRIVAAARERLSIIAASTPSPTSPRTTTP